MKYNLNYSDLVVKAICPLGKHDLVFLLAGDPNSIHFTRKFKAILLTEGGKTGNKQLFPLHEGCGYVYIRIYSYIAVSK